MPAIGKQLNATVLLIKVNESFAEIYEREYLKAICFLKKNKNHTEKASKLHFLFTYILLKKTV